jgi:DNA-binding XRE family transcriptional regulator
MNAQSKSSLPTTPSISPVIKRYGAPYALVNPGSQAENVLSIVERVVHAPLPAGYREIDDVVRTRENNPRHASALARARQRLAAHAEDGAKAPTVASLRLGAGLSQAKIAELLGNSQSSYSLIESGRRTDILLSTLKKLAAIFQISLDELDAAIENTKIKAS